MNCAVFFLKPNCAANAEVLAFCKERLTREGITIENEGELTAECIDREGIVDYHYAAIANYGALTPGRVTLQRFLENPEFRVSFRTSFGVDLNSVLLYSALELRAHLGCTVREMQDLWKSSGCKKMAPGLYIGRIAHDDHLYWCVNGFYLGLREKFTAPGGKVHWLAIRWDPARLSWARFRDGVIGATDPEKAPLDSLRGQMLTDWRRFHLPGKPDVQDNCIHASAGPLEGSRERRRWCGGAEGRSLLPIDQEPFLISLTSPPHPLTREAIERVLENPLIHPHGESKRVSLFDATENMDAPAAAACIQEVCEKNWFC
ncbi:putative Glutamine synthetase [Paratrimastix pyriformis]|uniref:Glutamine synthetase n=1 Tax=Paratrimastix pyriformis TaxID=342808 RepID=A0ABQ8USP6_9EUKA|nr:putative Glutamine synthetase [Paratrimastix pyriformis]